MLHRCDQLEAIDPQGEYEVAITRGGVWSLCDTTSRRLTEVDIIAEGIAYCPFCGRSLEKEREEAREAARCA